jgi:hypothetical protein
VIKIGIQKLWFWLTKPTLQVWGVTLLYYLAAYFVNGNLALLLLTIGYVAALTYLLGDFVTSLGLALLATLPIAKGKTLNLLLIPKELLTTRNAIFDVNYILGIYISDVILALLLWQLTRRWLALKQKVSISLSTLNQRQQWLVISWIGFLLAVLLPQIHNTFQSVVLLSILELCKVAILFCLPAWLGWTKTHHSAFAQILLAGIAFQAIWSAVQFQHGGPLGNYLEAYLPLDSAMSGMSTRENNDILRANGTFFDPSLLGTYLITLLTWIWFSKSKLLQPQWLIWSTLGLGLMTIILTSNRILIGLVIMAVLGIWRYSLTQKKTQQPTKSTGVHQRATLLKVGLIVIILAIGGFFAPYILARVKTLSAVFSQYGSATYRLQLGWYAIRIGMTEPWGVGLNLSPYFLATGFNQETISFNPSHPHNLWLQLWAETGWLGTIAFFCCIYIVYRPQQIRGHWQWQLTPAGWAGLAFLAAGMFYTVFINQIEVASWLAIMLGYHFAQTNKKT